MTWQATSADSHAYSAPEQEPADYDSVAESLTVSPSDSLESTDAIENLLLVISDILPEPAKTKFKVKEKPLEPDLEAQQTGTKRKFDFFATEVEGPRVRQVLHASLVSSWDTHEDRKTKTKASKVSARKPRAKRAKQEASISDEQETVECYRDVTSHGVKDELCLEPDLDSESVQSQDRPTKLPVSVVFHRSTLIAPSSVYEDVDGDVDGAITIHNERRELKAFLSELADDAGLDDETESYHEFLLEDFSMYHLRAGDYHLKSLHLLRINKNCHNKFFFDGKLTVGSRTLNLRRVPFGEFSIGNYGSEHHTVGSDMWIRSDVNAEHDYNVWYRLGRPAPEYVQFFAATTWNAELAKHFVDYMEAMTAQKTAVGISAFTADFSTWMLKHHQTSPEFMVWYRRRASSDFRTSIVAAINFLYKETYNVMGNDLGKHPLWRQVMTLTEYPMHKPLLVPIKFDTALVLPTVVTPYIYDCFKDLPCGGVLHSVPLNNTLENLRTKYCKTWPFLFPPPFVPSRKAAISDHDLLVSQIEVGDVISTPRDDDTVGSGWRREEAAGFSDVDRWFGLVQAVHQDPEDGSHSFDVMWLYRPVDTLCGVMKYPHNNELFLSDNCTCLSTAKVADDEVLSVHSVHWGGGPDSPAEFFCRQYYYTTEPRWVEYREELKRCVCRQSGAKQPEKKYRPGETVMVALEADDNGLEAAVIEAVHGEARELTIRWLAKRREVDSGSAAPPNELVWTDTVYRLRYSKIAQSCIVRVYAPGADIPAPYNCNGVGLAFYMSYGESVDSSGQPILVPLEKAPPGLRQGFDPTKPLGSLNGKLRGLDLFCGGGNFGRGLEDGGAINMVWANDLAPTPLHSYMANSPSANAFLGSIDDLHLRALHGPPAANVPHIGSVDFISGGSPCPGFSRLTSDKTTPSQRKNQSLVAAFATAVDIWRPRFGVLENVIDIVQTKARRTEDVLAQLICALVGLGYQTQLWLLEAWSYGAPQQRSRVFLVFAAPGETLPRQPLPTHSHPPEIRDIRLGMLTNGEPVLRRLFPARFAFPFVSAGAATRDLPDIDTGRVDFCVAHPDHRPGCSVSTTVRAQIAAIPTYPRGMTFARAWDQGRGKMPPEDRELFPPPSATNKRTLATSSGWGRVRPDRLFRTLVTALCIGDSRAGIVLHWDQNRPLTVAEGKRAQGFRDEDVLLGNEASMWRVVGNSVAREVALVLGLVIRESVAGLYEDGQ